MRKTLFSIVGIAVVALSAAGWMGQQPEPPATSGAYAMQCSTCHGAAMTGATAPAILTYVRYHTDAEAASHIRQTHPSLQLSDDILRQAIAGTRLLAGTNPAMATSGFTGRRDSPP